MNVKFFQRGLAIPIPAVSRLDFAVEKYSRHAAGGCFEATIAAHGSAADLWDLANWARYAVEITNANGSWVWGGYVRGVEIRVGNIRVTVDVNEMANRVAVAYTLSVAGEETTGRRQTTTWVSDADSQSEFGIKELLESEGGISAAAANAKRDYLLAIKKYPLGLAQVDVLSLANADVASATLTCEGWWHTTDWQYASIPTQVVHTFETIVTLEQTVGCDYNDDAQNVIALAQAVDSGATAWNLKQIELYVKRVGLPASDLTINVAENPDDIDPGATLASGTLAVLDVGTSYGWVTCTLTDALEIPANSSVFISPSYSGTPDQDNYYVFALDPAQGYGQGPLLKKAASTWSAVSADLPFRLRTDTLVSTDLQIQNLLVRYGQFFQRVFVETSTGVTLESFRNGDSDAKYEIEDLMSIGTAAGVRLLADVDRVRNVRVFAQPDVSAATVYLRSDGKFYERNKTPMDPSLCPVGFWSLLANVVPNNVETGRLSGLGAFFVEESEYDAVQDKLTYKPLGAADVWNFGERSG